MEEFLTKLLNAVVANVKKFKTDPSGTFNEKFLLLTKNKKIANYPS